MSEESGDYPVIPPFEVPPFEVLHFAAASSRKTEAQKAREYRAKVREMMEPVCELINEAARVDGLKIQFGLTLDGSGRQAIGVVDVMKVL